MIKTQKTLKSKNEIQEPVKFFEMRLFMDPSSMQDEVNQMVLNGIPMSMIDGKIGFVGHHRRIYDYTTNEVVMRFKKISLELRPRRDGKIETIRGDAEN